MGRIFKDKGITADGLVLPIDEFRLFLDMESAEFVPDKMVGIVEKAEEALEAEIPFLPLSYYREFWISGNRTKFQTPYFQRRNMLFPLVLAEKYEGKGRFVDKIADLVWAILEETTWVIHAHSIHTPENGNSSVPKTYKEDIVHGIDLFSAVTSAILTTALVYHRDALAAISPNIVERMEYEIKKRTIKPFLSIIARWSGSFGSRPNNWCPWIVSNVLYVTALIEEDQRTRVAVVNRSMNYLDNYTEGQPLDGGCDEGPGYWGAAGASLFDSAELIYDMTGGRIDVFSDEHLRLIGEYEPTACICKDRFINFGDSSSRMTADAVLLERFGRRTGSEVLTSYGRSEGVGKVGSVSHNHTYRAIKNLSTKTFTEEFATEHKKIVYLPYLKLFIARENQDAERGMYIACKGGHNRESHNHNDVGHFIVYYNGEPVVIDPGTVSYTRDTFGPKRYTIWAMQSDYHNLPVFDGIGEMPGDSFKSTREHYDEEAGKISYGLECAYSKEAGVVEYTRTAMIDGGTVVIGEDIHLDREREIDFHIMLHREPEILDGQRLALAMDRVLEYDERLSLEVEPFTPVGMDSKKHWETDTLYRLHFRVRAKDLTCEFKIK